MKKLFLLSTLFIFSFLISCQKERIDPQKLPETTEDNVLNESTLTKLDYFKLLTEQVLTTAKYSSDFKSWVYNECHKEYDGDYYVRFSHLLDLNEENNFQHWSIEESDYIKGIISEIEQIDINNNEEYTEPIIFIPFIEDLDIDSLINEVPVSIPEGVIAMEFDTSTFNCNGYTLTSNNSLTQFTSNIDEEHAWTNDVWVFSQHENASGIGARASTINSNDFTNNRVNGRAEYGGIIQVTNINKLESWVKGKLELRYFVISANGVKIKDREFISVKRKRFKNNNWVDFNDFIANWNTSNLGNFMIEGWTEIDSGGSGTTISVSVPPSCTGCPSYNISIASTDNDVYMGQSIVQFTDPVQPTDPTTTVYNISYANFKRKH